MVSMITFLSSSGFIKIGVPLSIELLICIPGNEYFPSAFDLAPFRDVLSFLGEFLADLEGIFDTKNEASFKTMIPNRNNALSL